MAVAVAVVISGRGQEIVCFESHQACCEFQPHLIEGSPPATGPGAALWLLSVRALNTVPSEKSD